MVVLGFNVVDVGKRGCRAPRDWGAFQRAGDDCLVAVGYGGLMWHCSGATGRVQRLSNISQARSSGGPTGLQMLEYAQPRSGFGPPSSAYEVCTSK